MLRLLRLSSAILRRTSTRVDEGVTMVFVFVFGTAIALMVAGLMNLTITELGAVDIKVRRERALQIAESGMEYYKWFLTHYPTDVQNGTGTTGPYVVPYYNASGTREGQYTLTVAGNYACNELLSVDVQSKGEIDGFPGQSRTVSARWMPPSVAEFSNLSNSSLWFGPSSGVTGPVQSNIGIRMSGTHSSVIQAGTSPWGCTHSYGCNPSNSLVGVTGTGGIQSLWRYPVAPISFYDIASLPAMKARAQNYGHYYAPRTGSQNSRGYHVTFNSNGTYTVKTVSATSSVAGQDASTGVDSTDYHGITTEATLGTYTPPASCGVLFFEDKVWVDGTYSGKITLVAADLTTSPNYDPSIILHDNLTRSTTSGADGLTLIAEKSIKISALSPNNITLEGIFMGLTGHVARNYYNSSSVATSIRNALTRVGTIVAYDDGGFWWTSFGTTRSGYPTRTAGYDRTNFFNPPPFTPTVYDTPRYVRWREE
jgi:hypothetical protein